MQAPKIDGREADIVASVLGDHEYFWYEEPAPAGKRIRLPTADELKARRADTLTPEKKSKLPARPANSCLPDEFLANAPKVLLAE